MSPIEDSKFSAYGQRAQARDRELERSKRIVRMEYLKPLVMLVVGAGAVMTRVAILGDGEETSGATLAALYPLRLAIAVVFGITGLWIACKMWLGSVGPLALGALRLAAIIAVTDLVAFFLAPLAIFGVLIQLGVYLGLLAWLFELEFFESVVVAIITFLLKYFAGRLFLATFASMA